MWLKLETGMAVILLLFRVLSRETRVMCHLPRRKLRGKEGQTGRCSHPAPRPTPEASRHWARLGAMQKSHLAAQDRESPRLGQPFQGSCSRLGQVGQARMEQGEGEDAHRPGLAWRKGQGLDRQTESRGTPTSCTRNSWNTQPLAVGFIMSRGSLSHKL